MSKKIISLVLIAGFIGFIPVDALSRGLKINIQHKKNVTVEEEDAGTGDAGDYFDFTKEIIPTNQKDISQYLLESLKKANKNNLSSVMTTEILLQFGFLEALKKTSQPKAELFEKVIKNYADVGSKNYGEAIKYIKELEKETSIMNGEINLDATTLQAMMDRFYADERVGEFYVGPDFREILRAQLRTFVEQTTKLAKKDKKLEELHAEIIKSLNKGVHDMYVAILLGQCLEYSKDIKSRPKPFLINQTSDAFTSAIKNISWQVDATGKYLVR